MPDFVVHGPPPAPRKRSAFWSHLREMAWVGLLLVACPPVGMLLAILKLIENAVENGVRRGRQQ